MISNALFAQQAIRGFTRNDFEISQLQEQLSSGQNDPRVSAGPARALELSALRDLRSDIATQTAIGRSASDRLAIGDAALGEVSDMMRELYQIALQAGNDTLTTEAHGALRMQAQTMRPSLLAVANTTDPQGRPVFSGTAPGPAFTQTANGVQYQGDLSVSTIQMGPQGRLETGLNGARVFGSDAGGAFALLDKMILSLTEPVLSARDKIEAQAHARLDLDLGTEGPINFTLQGPVGQTEISLPLGAGQQNAQIAAINAVADETGIRATAAPDGSGIILVAGGKIKLSDQIGPENQPATRPLMRLTALDAEGTPARDAVALRPAALTRAALVGESADMVEHMAQMRAGLGAMGQAIETRLDRLSQTSLRLDQAVSSLQDVNVADAVTRLQGLLLNQQAAQQTYVKITARSLFDYLG